MEKDNLQSGVAPIIIILVLVFTAVVVTGIWFLNKDKTSDEPIASPVLTDSPVVITSTPSINDDTLPKTSSVKEFDVTGTSFKFSVTEMTVKKGDTVKIVFTNGQGTHDWVIDEFNAKTNILKAGESQTIEFVADKVGTFEYYCSVGSHRAMGMKGNLTVAE